MLAGLSARGHTDLGGETPSPHLAGSKGVKKSCLLPRAPIQKAVFRAQSGSLQTRWRPAAWPHQATLFVPVRRSRDSFPSRDSPDKGKQAPFTRN